jgi:DNA-binding transcriptional LysR family regulator
VYTGVEEIRREAHEIRTLCRGTLAVGAMPVLSAGFVQRVAHASLQERPGIALDILWTERVRLVDWVASGKMDAALINAAHGHTEVETKLLSNQGAMCRLPPAYALAQCG